MLLVQLLSTAAKVPQRQTPGSVGYDLYASRAAVLLPGKVTPVHTDVAVALPPGHFGDVRPRSSLAKIGVSVRGGVIDSDYRGELVVLLHIDPSDEGDGPRDYLIKEGDRIAQLLVLPCATPEVAIVVNLPPTQRAAGGFGSTGK